MPTKVSTRARLASGRARGVVLVVTPVAAAGLAVAGAGAVAVGALAPCVAAVANVGVHGVYCSTPGRLLSTCVDAGLVGWLVVA